MAKASQELQKLRRAQGEANPTHNYLPSAGAPYPGNRVAHEIVFASPESVGIWVQVEYLDENGVEQRRKLGKGIWPMQSTQINGYRVHTDLAGDLITEISTKDFEISVMLDM